MTAITKTMTRRTRRRSKRDIGRFVLEIALGAALLVAFLGFGGVTHPARGGAHVLLGLAAVALLFTRGESLRAVGGVVLRFALAGGALLGALATGILPMPSALGRVSSRAWDAERWAAGWDWTSLDPEATLGAMSGTTLALSCALAGAAVAARRQPRALENAAIGATWLLMLVAALHAGVGNRALFGVWPVATGAFFAPFVNANHFGTALLFGYPILLDRALREQHLARWVASTSVLAVLGMAAWASSIGAFVVLVAQSALVVSAYVPRIRTGAAAFGLIAILLAGVTLYFGPSTGRSLGNLNGRLPLWWSSLEMLGDHWAFGVGGGAYGSSIESYRTDYESEAWFYAHNDWLQWVVETGGIGVLALGFACALVFPWRGATGPGFPWVVALGGVLLHAAVDFPLKLGAIAMAAAVVAGARAVHFSAASPAPVALVRGIALVLVIVHPLAAAWEARQEVVVNARAALAVSWEGADAEAAELALRRWAPGSWEIPLGDARRALRAGDEDSARAALLRVVDVAPRSARAQRAVALHALLLKDYDLALQAAEHAVKRGPADNQNWYVRAVVMTRSRHEQAPGAWADVVRHGRPAAIARGWELLPVGIYWVSAVEDASTATRLSVARFVLSKGDLDASIVGFMQIRESEPTVFPLELADIYIEAGDLAAAESYLQAAIETQGEAPELIERLATLREREGRWSDALQLWSSLTTVTLKQRLRIIEASRRAEGPLKARSRVRAWELAGEARSPEIVLQHAALEAELGDAGECMRLVGTVQDRARHKRALDAMVKRCTGTSAPEAALDSGILREVE